MEQHNNRRAFLKKAAYAAPTVLALGALSTPMHANGSGGFRQSPVTTGEGVNQDTDNLEFPIGSDMDNFFNPGN